MLYVYTGTDREKARAAMNAELKKHIQGATVVRVGDANALDDLQVALGGRGMFDTSRVVVLDSVLSNEEMRSIVLDSLPAMKDTEDSFFMLEEKPDAATRRTLEKYAEVVEKFDAPKRAEDKAIFALKSALAQGDKKKLWIGIERELISGKSPEAVHGFLFWAAKDMVLRGGSERGRTLVAELAELPHAARRRGEELEYALERFVLTEV